MWTTERLTRQQVRSKNANRRHSEFKVTTYHQLHSLPPPFIPPSLTPSQPDPMIPPPFTSTNEDYWDSGWSRGHMVPAGDCKHSQHSMDESFFLTHIVPQDIDNNGGYMVYKLVVQETI